MSKIQIKLNVQNPRQEKRLKRLIKNSESFEYYAVMPQKIKNIQLKFSKIDFFIFGMILMLVFSAYFASN